MPREMTFSHGSIAKVPSNRFAFCEFTNADHKFTPISAHPDFLRTIGLVALASRASHHPFRTVFSDVLHTNLPRRICRPFR